MKYLACLALLLSACQPKPDTGMTLVTPTAKSARFDVKRVGVLEDEIAYGQRRGIYIITDKTTETEYIGISGIGISETGSHTVGKNHHAPDER